MKSEKNRSRSTTRELAEESIAIRGMHCASCVSSVENVIWDVDGVHSVGVNLAVRM